MRKTLATMGILVLALQAGCMGPSAIYPRSVPTGVEPCDDTEPLGLFEGETEAWRAARATVRERATTNSISAATALALVEADKVELFLLDPNLHHEQSDTLTVFPVAPYGLYAPVLEHVSLDPTEAGDAVAWWQEILLASDGQCAISHFPTHGIRFRRGNYVVFETTVCWKCRTFWVYKNGRPTWTALPHQVIAEPVRQLFKNHFPVTKEFKPGFAEPEN